MVYTKDIFKKNIKSWDLLSGMEGGSYGEIYGLKIWLNFDIWQNSLRFKVYNIPKPLAQITKLFRPRFKETCYKD